MIVAQVFLEAMEGCHLFLSPLFVMQTEIFRVSPSAVVQVFVGLQRWRPDDFVGCYRSPFGTGLVGWVPLPPAGFCSGASMLLVLVGLSTGAPFPGWFHELVWQLPVLARLSSALLFPWNFRCTVWQLLVCVELQGALPSARWFRWTVWRLPICVQLRGALPSARWFRWTAALFGHFSCFWKGPPVLPFPTFFHQRLFLLFLSSFCLNFIKVTKFPATFARRSHKIVRKLGPARPIALHQSLPTSPPTNKLVPRKLGPARPIALHQSLPTSPPTNKLVPRKLGPARPIALHQSLPTSPPTNKLVPRKIGPARPIALHQSLPTSPPTNKLVPRKIGAPRLAGDPCSEYFPSNEGELLFPVLCFQLSVQCTTGTPGNKLKTILNSLWRFKLSGFHCLYIWQLLILPAYCMTFLWLCKHFRDIHKKYCMANSSSAMFDTFVLDFCIFIHSSPHNKFPDLPGHHVDWPAVWRREANHWFPLLLLLHYFVV